MEKTENQSVNKTKSFITEVLLFLLFVVVDVFACVFGYENYLGLSILIVGLFSLFLNDMNKVIDLLLALIWSVLYAYFCFTCGLIIQCVLISGAYLITKVMNMFIRKSDNLVEQKKRLKVHQVIALAVVLVSLIIGSYFISKVWSGEVLGLLDSISASILFVCLFIKSSKFEEYFVLRLVSMISVVALWVTRGFVVGFDTGVASIAIMFIAFMIFDNVRIYRFSKEKPTTPKKEDEKDDLFDNEEYKEAAKKYERENPRGLPSKSIGVDKDSKRK